MNLIENPTRASALADLPANALVTSISARAGEIGYRKDAEGTPVTTDAGGCVRTGNWKDSIPSCPEPTLVVERGRAMIAFAAVDPEFFGFDSVKLGDQIKAELGTMVGAVENAEMNHGITITGHADRIGPSPYNAGLALKRAEAVKDYLVFNGIPADPIANRSNGDSAPLGAGPNLRSKRKPVRCPAPIAGWTSRLCWPTT